MTPYPVIEQRALGAVRRALLRPARREPSEIPPHLPGTELVAYVNGNYERLPSPLRGNERVLLDATSVLVVDVSPERIVDVRVELASSVPGESFVVHVGFSCSVLDAVEAAPRRDIAPLLANHIKADAQLMSAGHGFSVDDAMQLREIVPARVKAWCMGRRPPFTGIEVALASVDIEVPDDLRDFASKKRGQEREHDLDSLSENFTFQQAELLEEVISRGPEALQALALRLNEPRYINASDQAYSRRNQQREYLLKLIRTFSDDGHFDGVSVDTPRLLDEFMDSLGVGQRNSDRKSLVLGPDDHDDNGRSELAGPADDEDDASDHREDPPDEEILDG